MVEKRTKIVRVRFSEDEFDQLGRKRADAGCATRAGYLRQQFLQHSCRTPQSHAGASEIAEQIGRITIAVNRLGPGSSSGAKALAREVRELHAAIYSWMEG